MPRTINITRKMQRFISKNYLLMTMADIAKKYSFDKGVVKRYLVKNNLIVPKEISINLRTAKLIGKTTFSKAEDKYIKAHYLDMAFSQIGKILGRSDCGIERRIKRLGLVIPPEVLTQRIIDSRIKPGAIPANKGKIQADYMTPEAIARTAVTRFKKGNAPYNTRSDFEISIREDHDTGISYQHIRVSLGVWILLHRYNYEKFIGEIPEGYTVTFKDKDSMNCDPLNLVLMTRADNMIQNSGPLNLTDRTVATYMATASKKVDQDLKNELLQYPELLELKRNELLLTREIKKHEQQ